MVSIDTYDSISPSYWGIGHPISVTHARDLYSGADILVLGTLSLEPLVHVFAYSESSLATRSAGFRLRPLPSVLSLWTLTSSK